MVPTLNTFRDIKRVADILSVMIRYGFEDLLHATGLDRIVGHKFQRLLLKKKDEITQREPVPVRLRKAMEELGPTFIKMGQVLSTRPDLIPQDWIDEFCKLQDDCPKMPFEQVQARLDKEFGGKTDDLFQSIDPKPLAAASIGQTHLAVLADGTNVVLKILRPGIDKKIAADMEVLAALAKFLEVHFADLGYSPLAVVEEFASELAQELDLMHEGRATDRLRSSFLDDPRIIFPKVYWQATTKNILTLEKIEGELLSRVDLDELDSSRKNALVAVVADAVFKQCFELNFFHADPHPGNLFLMSGDRVGFIDCGMTGHLDSRMSDNLADIFYGVVSNDIDRIICAVVSLTEVDPTVTESNAFRADISEYIGQFHGMDLGQMDVGALLSEFFQKLQKYHIRCPASIVFLIKAIITIEGVAADMAPGFDMIAYATPYLKKLIERRYSPSSLRKRFQKTIMNSAELAETLPGELGCLVRQLRRHQFQVRFRHEGLEELNSSITHTGLAMSKSAIFAALLIGSSVLIHAECVSPHGGKLMGFGIFGLLGAAVLGVQTALAYRTRSKVRRML